MPHSWFFFNDTATTEIYTLSLHDALPISDRAGRCLRRARPAGRVAGPPAAPALAPEPGRGARDPRPGRARRQRRRSEEHTSELQSRQYLVCRLLLEKKTSVTSCHGSAPYI